MDQPDWTGVSKDRQRPAPLDSETFVARLRLLESRARDIKKLREAMKGSRGLE